MTESPGDRTVSSGGQGSVDEVEQLLAAAEKLLATGGYEGLRVDDVLHEAGLSTRAFYRHFRGKSELFLALFDREAALAGDRLRRKVASVRTPAAKVEAWVAATLALAYDGRLARRTRVFLVERQVIAAAFPEDVIRCVRQQLAPLEAAIDDGRSSGAFPAAEPTRDALAIHHLCSGLMTDKLLGTGTLGRDDAVALATRFALATLRSDT
ncbi:MAG TPA: TetR/AcrR family transcriptional regulator [Acidimicrobiia bacterium]|nr:TetR/AcrR family transcriptional regulator [Acidimicrobiia bacterium]